MMEMDYSVNVSKDVTLVRDTSLNLFSQIRKDFFEGEQQRSMNYTLTKTCLSDPISFMGYAQEETMKECFERKDSLTLVVGQLSFDSSSYTEITQRLFVTDERAFVIYLVCLQMLAAFCAIFGVWKWTKGKFVLPLKDL